MSVRWERLAGDTSDFAIRVAFHADPHDGEGATPEEALSWGGLQIWVNGKNLCAHVEQAEQLSYCHWYLLQLLEWIAENWDPLFHETKLPAAGAEAAQSSAEVLNPSRSYGDERSRTAGDWFAWRQRHSIQSARNGGLFPDISMRRVGDLMEVAWQEFDLPGAEGVDFLVPSGTSLHPIGPMAAAVHEVVEEASRWLLERIPESDQLQALVAAVDRLSDDLRSDARVAWIAGLGRTFETMRRRWAQLGERLTDVVGADRAGAALTPRSATPLVVTGSSDVALLFGSVSPVLNDEDVWSLAEAVLSIEPPGHLPIDALTEHVPLRSETKPWQQGYMLAEDISEDFLTPGGAAVDVEAILAELAISVSELSLSDQSIRAVSVVGARHSPTIFLNSTSVQSSDAARRFTLAHELCHLLFDRAWGAELAIASGPWAPPGVEARANAFAAMLLMGPERIEQAAGELGVPVRTPEGVDAISRQLRVSPVALTHQLQNVNLISEHERDGLLRTSRR